MVSFLHSTRKQNLSELRRLYKSAKGEAAARMARWMLANMADEELATAFKLQPQAINGVRARFTAKAKKLSDIESEAGE